MGKLLRGCGWILASIVIPACHPLPTPEPAVKNQPQGQVSPETWIDRLGHRNPLVQRRAVEELVALGESVVPKVTPLLEKKTAGAARCGAAQVLGRLGTKAESAIPALLESLNDREWPDREMAAEALGLIGRQAAQVIPALITALKEDPDERVRAKAAKSLGRFASQAGTDSKAAIQALRGAMKDSDLQVQMAAAGALGCFGPRAQAAIAELKAAAQSEHFVLRQAAEESLKAITPTGSPTQTAIP